MAKLQIVQPGGDHAYHDLSEEKISIGRTAGNALRLDNPSVSSSHAEIVFEGNLYHIHDLGSTNGTYINDENVKDAILQNGDQIRFGAVEVVFQDAEPVSEEPLPEKAVVAAEVAKGSSRPAGFVNSSPMPKIHRSKDPMAIALFTAVAIAIMAFSAASAFVYQMSSTP